MHEQESHTAAFLGPQEFGSRLQPPLSAARIRKLCDDGKVQAFRTPNGNRIIPAAELERFAAKRGKRG
jgi:hypothetical protein